MVVVSRPGDEIVGGGKNAKYVRECQELVLGNKGIEKIRDFEPFVNLESLWLHGNKLKKLNNLDANFRIKALYVQDNQICTLKGSLSCFTFLETLDISNNQLRDLEKLLKALEKFRFMRNLNLKGNPCCEEPDYRLLVIHAMPGLKVLDQHVITELERTKARGMIGGDVATLTVAFGKRAPERPASYYQPHPAQSAIERELVTEAKRVAEKREIAAAEAELAMFSHNPHPDIPSSSSLPPNAGTRRAMETWHSSLDGESMGATTSTSHSPETGTRRRTRGMGATSSSSTTPLGSSTYIPKDRLVLYSCSPSQSQELLKTERTLTKPVFGTIKFEQEAYDKYVDLKTTGTLGGWDLKKKEVQI